MLDHRCLDRAGLCCQPFQVSAECPYLQRRQVAPPGCGTDVRWLGRFQRFLHQALAFTGLAQAFPGVLHLRGEQFGPNFFTVLRQPIGLQFSAQAVNQQDRVRRLLGQPRPGTTLSLRFVRNLLQLGDIAQCIDVLPIGEGHQPQRADAQLQL